MIDIVERLGNLIECEMDKAQCELYATAKAEIERLGALAAVVREQAIELTDTRAEIERLTAALQSLTVDPPATLDEPDTDAEVVIKMRDIARRALENKP